MIRADWKLAETMVEDDPFEAVVYTPGIEIDLTASEDELIATLRELSMRESSYAMSGISCPLKDAGQDCLTCPEATLDNSVRLSKLCRVGKDEATVWAAGEARQAAWRGPILEMARVADEMSEIGHIPGEIAEMLTAAGL